MKLCLFKKIVYGSFKQWFLYSGIYQAYSEPCVTRTYLKPWYIQNPGILRAIHNPDRFRIRGTFRTMSNITMQRFAKIVNGYNYFRII